MQGDAVHIEAEGQYGVLIRGEADVEVIAAGQGFDAHMFMPPRRHGAVVLEVVDEQEAAFTVGTHGEAQWSGVRGGD